MPTESSVVANLIRDMNTHRLPSEPSDSALFQPAPGEPPKPAPRARAVLTARVAAKPAANVVATTAAKRSTSAWKGWLQFTFATLLVGGWAYVATQLDPYGESAERAALPLPLPIPLPQPAVNVTPIAPAAVIPAAPTAEQPAPAAITSPAPPAPETSAAPPPPAPASATADAQPSIVEPSAPPTHASKKHRRHGSSKVKPSVAKTKLTSDATEKPAAEKPATAPPPPPKPEPAVPAKPPAAPSKPPQQSDDSENPLR